MSLRVQYDGAGRPLPITMGKREITCVGWRFRALHGVVSVIVMRALIIGGTGKVGSAVVAQLLAWGHDAVVAGRTPSVGGVAMDLAQPGAVLNAAKGFDAAFLITPLGPDESEIGIRAIDELRAAGVHKTVHLGIQNLEAMAAIPHFKAKIPIRDHLLADGTSIMLAANFFFQNDLNILPAIQGAGVYPMPVGTAGVYSVDCRDIGRAGARALTMDDWNGTTQPLCGEERLTGPLMAQMWSRVLGKPVIYPGDDTAPFIDGLRAAMPSVDTWLEHDMRTMMEVTQAQGCLATPDDIAAAKTIIGQPQRSYADFITDLANREIA